MTEAELVALTKKYAAKYEQLRSKAGDLAARLWLTHQGIDDAALAKLLDVLIPTVEAIGQASAQLAAAHIALVSGEPMATLDASQFTSEALRGVPASDVFARPMIRARTLISEGQTYEQARQVAANYARELASTNVALAHRQGAHIAMMGNTRVVGYRRVLTGKSCALCVAASTQRYHKANLMPIHRNCDCGIAPIVGNHDPGQVINTDLLSQIKDDQRLKISTSNDGELGPVLGRVVDYWDSVPDMTATERKIARQLDADSEAIAQNLTAGQRAHISQWQSLDRTYQQVQAAARGEQVPAEIQAIRHDLDEVIMQSPLRRDLDVVWRGNRSVLNALRMSGTDLQRVVGRTITTDSGFMATSVSRHIVETQFTQPPSHGGAVIFRLEIPRGTPAAWMPAVGSPELRDQAELLFQGRHKVDIVELDDQGDVPILRGRMRAP